MRINKKLMIGLMMMSMATTAQAAVTGTLKQDVEYSVSGDEIIVADAGEKVSILENEEDGYIILLNDTYKQFVEKELVEVEGVLTTTTAEETKLRDSASPEGDIIKFLDEDVTVSVIERQDDFYKVTVEDVTGYIYKSQINETGLENVTYKKTVVAEVQEANEDVESVETSLRDDVVAFAKKQVGGRYVYGGNNLATGVDCSGFVQQVMKKFGVSVERSSRSQYASSGKSVSVSNLQPGDLVFYGNNGKVNHVAIYIGDSQIVHASDERSGIKISKLYYGKPIIGCKSVL